MCQKKFWIVSPKSNYTCLGPTQQWAVCFFFQCEVKKAAQALPKLFSSHFTYHLDHTPELLNQS